MTNWEKVKLGRLLTESRIESSSPDTSRRIRVKLNVGGVEKRPETNDKEGATKYFIRKKGQFIYGRQNLHKGAFGIVPEELDGFESSSDIPAFDVDSSCYPEWIYYFFKQGDFYLSLESLAKGVGSKRIHPEQLFQISIPLPPKETQKAIIEKILTLEKNYATVVEENATQLSLLTALRQAILTEAVQGRLTTQWRKENPNQEHARELLQRIAVEKAKLIKEKKISKEKLLPSIEEDEVPFVVPEGWVWCLSDEIVSFNGGVAKGKELKGKMVQTPYLRVANVQRGHLDLSVVKEIIVSENDYQKYQLQIDDLLMIEGGDPDKVGRCAIWRNEIPNCIHQNHIFRVRVYLVNELNVQFIETFFNSPVCQKYYEKSAKRTTNLASINKSQMRMTPLAIPPLSEQHAIVEKVNTLMAYCDELEQQVRQSKADLELLMQSVLSEVFGTKNQAIGNISTQTKLSGKEILMPNDTIQPIYKVNTLNMELLEILQQQGGKIAAVNLWKMSKYQKDIDAFYEALKKEVEEKKTIRESSEKGWLELVAP